MTPKQRIRRAEYLHARMNELAAVNPEQAEAYAERLNRHWQKTVDVVEKGEKA